MVLYDLWMKNLDTWMDQLLIDIVTVFFFTYSAFEMPSNLLLKKLRPSRWLPIIMVAWGIVMVISFHFLYFST